MNAVAAAPRVFCKLSGLVTEAPSDTPDHVFQPFVDHLLRCFGPGRLMWGSDWPVVNLRCDYGEWHDRAHRLIRRHAADGDAIMAINATEFYRLDVGSIA